MQPYPKINSLFKRDMSKPKKPIIIGDYADEVFRYLQNNEWIFTEKVDGTNIRAIWDGGKITVKGRTDEAQLSLRLLDSIHAIFEPLQERFIADFPDGVTFYGEGYGAKIQKGGGNYRADNSFVMFDALVGGIWVRRESLEAIAAVYNIEIVPVVGTGTISDGIELVRYGMKSTWGDFQAEGIVLKPVVPLLNQHGNQIVTKLKTKDFTDLILSK